MSEPLVAQFAELGIHRNEALAYLTLVEEGGTEGMTGYEVAARSGIPRSAVYTVLRRLEALGAAFAVGEPARYVPTSPDRLVANLRQTALTQLAGLDERLRALPRRSQPEPIWILSRYNEVMERAEAMVRSAEQSVWLSVWPRELERLRPALDSVAHRPLHRVLHSPARLEPGPEGFSTWADDSGDDEAKASWSHKILLVVDRREALIGGTEPEADNQAVRTTNPSLVDVATNHIILDITRLAGPLGLDCADVVSPMMRPHLHPASQRG